MSIDGAPCVVCNAGRLIAKVGNAVGKFAGQTYYVCSNWQAHKDGGPKSPWILASDTAKIEKYLADAAGESAPKRPAPAGGIAQYAKKPAAKPAAVNTEHIAVTTVAKLAHIESRLEYLISLVEPKNSNNEEHTDEPVE